MAPGDDVVQFDDEQQDRLLRRPVTIPVPGWLFAGRVVNVAAGIVAVVLPLVLASAGLVVALAGGLLAQRDTTEAVGTLGIEVGAAMWFAGAVTLGARPRPTVLRVVALAATGVGGLVLIVSALVGSWSGVALDLAMEFGVGAVAVVVLDFLILGVVQANLDRLAGRGSPVAPV